MKPGRAIGPVAVTAAVAAAVVAVAVALRPAPEPPAPREREWRRWAGQRLMLSINAFRAEDPRPGERLPAALAEILGSRDIGGVVLFSDDLRTAEQVRRLTAELRRIPAGGPPLLVAVDQEGGTVARLPAEVGPSFPGNMALGAGFEARGTSLAEAVGLAQAHQLRYLGINVNLAPAVDVSGDPGNPVAGTRSFGDDPERVARLGAAVSAGLQAGGVASTLKHFPGHGSTRTDSHTGLPRVDRDHDRILPVDLLPFERIIRARPPDLVMTAHVQYPALDGSVLPGPGGVPFVRPATVSRAILVDLLRRRLGYEGVVVTDALNMASIRQLLGPERAVVEAFAASADIALMPVDLAGPEDGARLDAVLDRVVEALRTGELDPGPFERSAARVMDLRRRLGRTATVLGAQERAAQLPEERRLDAEVARAAVTVVKGAARLPLDLGRPLRLLAPGPDDCARLERALSARRGDPRDVTCAAMTPGASFAFEPPPPGSIAIGAYGEPRRPVGEGAAPSPEPASAPDQAALLSRALAEARAAGATTVLVALRSPFELPRLDAVSDVQVALFGEPADGEPGGALSALADVLAGRQDPVGRLPVRLGGGD